MARDALSVRHTDGVLRSIAEDKAVILMIDSKKFRLKMGRRLAVDTGRSAAGGVTFSRHGKDVRSRFLFRLSSNQSQLRKRAQTDLSASRPLFVLMLWAVVASLSLHREQSYCSIGLISCAEAASGSSESSRKYTASVSCTSVADPRRLHMA
jgi:hypothetical protein